jgi:hypothetical protein
VMVHILDGGLDVGFRGDIAGYRMTADGKRDALGGGSVAIEDADFRPRLGESSADRFADPLPAAGDERDFAVETKKRFHEYPAKK